MVRGYVFDEGVLSLYVGGNPKARAFLDEVREGTAEGLVVDLSLAEFQHKLCHSAGRKAAETEGKRFRNSSLRIVHNSPFLDMAWRFKCRYTNRFSLVDCTLLAVAQVHACRIVTTDGSFENLHEPRVSTHLLPPR